MEIDIDKLIEKFRRLSSRSQPNGGPRFVWLDTIECTLETMKEKENCAQRVTGACGPEDCETCRNPIK